MITEEKKNENELYINIKNLTFGYPGKDFVLRNFYMQLTSGSRCLLIGANGAGKSTILRILAGRHITKPDNSVFLLGRSAFHDTRLNFERSYLDTDWGMRTVAFAGYGCPLQADIQVQSMMIKLQEEYPGRRDELIKLLGIDPEWRMHQVSDGQRRRVQIFLGLLRPFKVLLMDEITVSLDLVVRQDLLQWLKRESETNGATIVYATHIFDGLDDWPTHLHYLSNRGTTGWQGPIDHLNHLDENRKPVPLLRIAEIWLRKEMNIKNEKEKAAGPAAQSEHDPTQLSYIAGGGFSSGRMKSYLC
jgi:CCR4-NOT complex subunit CAF16